MMFDDGCQWLRNGLGVHGAAVMWGYIHILVEQFLVRHISLPCQHVFNGNCHLLRYVCWCLKVGAHEWCYLWWFMQIGCTPTFLGCLTVTL